MRKYLLWAGLAGLTGVVFAVALATQIRDVRQLKADITNPVAIDAPHELNEVIVVFQDDVGGIGQQTGENTYQSNTSVDEQIKDHLQAILPEEDIIIESKVLFNDNLADLSTRRQARVDKLQEEGLNRPNSLLADRRLVFAQAKSRTRSTEELITLFQQDPEVKYAQPNYIYNFPNTTLNHVQSVGVLNLENATQLWNIFNNQSGAGMGADNVWNQHKLTGKGIIIAGLDTGVDINHPDLKPNIWHNFGESNCTDGIDNDKNGYIDDCSGWDFGDQDNDVKGSIFHGTHTAGIIAAAKNGNGVVGVAPEARLMALKVFRGDGAARTSDIVSAIDYAWRNNADVISLSLGRKDKCSTIEQQAIERANAAGVFVIASSGNSDPDNGFVTPFSNAPAVCSGVFTIGATDDKKVRADYSNYYQTMVKALAPGGNRSDGVLSTIPDGKYGSSSGTSMAVPHIAGLVALMYQLEPSLLPDEISKLLCDHAEDGGNPGIDNEYGCGFVNATNVINALDSDNTDNDLSIPSPPPIPVGGTQTNTNPPAISNARWTPTTVTADPVRSLLAFSVCDKDNNLTGGAINLYKTGSTQPFTANQLSWSTNPPNRSVANCEDPYSFETLVDLSTLATGMHCADIEVTDGTGKVSNKITNLCLTIADRNFHALTLTPRNQVIQLGIVPQSITVTGGQNYTFELDAGLTGITKVSCSNGTGGVCQLSAPSGVGTAIVSIVDANGKTGSAKIFVNGSSNGKLNIQKVSSITSVGSGGTITYSITYRNDGTTAYTALTLTDDYDETMVRISKLPSNCTDDGKQIACSVGLLSPGQSKQVTYEAVAL